jgi:hypothetical protein
MIVYNVSIQIDEDVKEDWLKWMKEKHIPDVMKTGVFIHFNFLKILNEDTKNTYAIQYFCKDIGHLNTYFDEFASGLQEEHSLRYNNKFVAFRTIMEEV